MALTDWFARSDGGARRPVLPNEGVAMQLPGAAEREVTANLVLTLWTSVADGFRADEHAHEAADFRADAATALTDLAQLPSDRAPSPALCRRLLAVLATQLPERFAALHDRVDELTDQCRTREQELTVLQLGSSWQTDELDRCRQMIADALRGREVTRPTGTLPLVSELLAALLNVARPAAAVQAYGGERTTRTDAPETAIEPEPTSESESSVVRRVLKQVLDGTAHAGRLARVLDDQALAERITDLADENRRYRELLLRIGLLPRE